MGNSHEANRSCESNYTNDWRHCQPKSDERDNARADYAEDQVVHASTPADSELLNQLCRSVCVISKFAYFRAALGYSDEVDQDSKSSLGSDISNGVTNLQSDHSRCI